MQSKFINKFSDEKNYKLDSIYIAFRRAKNLSITHNDSSTIAITRSTIDHTEKETIILLDPRFHSPFPSYFETCDKTKPNQGLTAN